MRPGSARWCAGTQAATTIGVLAPLTSVWANTADGRPNARARGIGEALESLVDGLFARRLDVHVVDTAFVLGSELDGATLREGRVAVNALVIPPVPVMERAVAARLAEFVKAGGRLIWGGELPSASSESGADDEELLRLVKPLTPPGRRPSAAAAWARAAFSCSRKRRRTGWIRRPHGSRQPPA